VCFTWSLFSPLQTALGLLQARQTFAAGRIAAVTTQKLATQQQQTARSNATLGSSSSSTNQHGVLQATGQGAARTAHAGFRTAPKSTPWFQLPPEEVSQKLAAAAARHKALAGIMTPDQREAEERCTAQRTAVILPTNEVQEQKQLQQEHCGVSCVYCLSGTVSLYR
jgi:hypothetical protein